ncbi:hypothetical protein CHS0354_023149 [Potamilus streckersoni]|uniref:Uncharacterized protein n=1 Tax=Potamilus streckersoni TaxID=2493646 RepID=A0AAE0VGD9_9BIVA|nr:hypothetical protein CHS0354_023149 [Potamilus streckersoni]
MFVDPPFIKWNSLFNNTRVPERERERERSIWIGRDKYNNKLQSTLDDGEEEVKVGDVESEKVEEDEDFRYIFGFAVGFVHIDDNVRDSRKDRLFESGLIGSSAGLSIAMLMIAKSLVRILLDALQELELYNGASF